MMLRCAVCCLVLTLGMAKVGRGQSPLQEQLVSEGAVSLAKAARSDGDPQRGAILFHQPFLACAKCHHAGKTSSLPNTLGVSTSIGPDLTKPDKTATAESIIESVLEPSKFIKKGFEPVVVQTTDGKSITGLLIEETADKIVLRDVSRDVEQGGVVVTLPRSQVEERVMSKTSIMPAGQVNVLGSRQQFLDLARYLIEIAEGGPERAKQLQPPPSLFAFVLPEYEKQIDHGGMLGSLDEKSFQRGAAIYNRLCINCHGTKDQPGSLPTSLKFAEGKFKNGSDPYRMYQTLTHGFGLMVAQTWMVPQQKYDVIHYVRETYLKPHNPSQYAKIDAAYLASLPKGTTRGPAPSNVEPWSSMNYGPDLIATYEVGSDGKNFAQKGIAVRLDPGPGGVSRGRNLIVFDEDTLRISAAWSATPQDTTKFIDWHGINFDGRHQIHPRVSGGVAFANPTGPGWANPETGRFDEERVLGRDDRRYGPLPRAWGRYRGLYHFGDQVIVSYSVGDTSVLEMPGVIEVEAPARDQTASPADKLEQVTTGDRLHPVFTRTFEIGPRSRAMLLKVATHPSASAAVETIGVDDRSNANIGAVAMLSVRPAKTPELPPTAPAAAPLSFSGKTRMDVAKAGDFDLTSKDFTIAARIKTKMGGTILCQAPIEGGWAPDGKTFFVRGGRLAFDIGWVGAAAGKANVADDRWHDVAMTWQHETGRVCFFVDGKLDGQGTLKPKAVAEKQAIRVGFTSPNFPDPTFFVGQLAEVRFVQRAVADEDIAKISDRKDESLIAHWKLDAAKDGIVADITGRGHDGTVSGGFGSGPLDETKRLIAAGASPMPAGAKWQSDPRGALLLSLPAGNDPLKFVLSVTSLDQTNVDAEVLAALVTQPPLDLTSLTKGGPRRYPEVLTTDVIVGPDSGPFAVDVLSPPVNNPWLAQTRLTGFDFFDDGDRAAVCSWDGDVWLVTGLRRMGTPARPDLKGDKLEKVQTKEKAVGLESPSSKLTWQRIASGLFQPLGLKIVEGQIYVTCRDQIAILRDLNGDNEADFIECFNNDHQVTEHFHEFAMGLQTDADGNFYYAKSGRHALTAVVPHHGTLLRVSKDGSKTDILATGFRAANGVCLNPDGSFVVTDQEGFWNPKNRINWVVPPKPGEKPHFYGNMFGYTDVTDSSDSAMESPLCWITNAFDRSPAELLWVTSDKWGPLKGSLLNLSYGFGKVFIVPHEKTANGLMQGGMCELPLPTFPTGIMRGRFSPADGQLYVCGMFAWAGSATQPGGFYRIRATGRPAHAPIGLKATKRGMSITFSEPLDPATANDAARYVVQTWSLKRTANYGSKHYDEKTLKITKATLSADGRTVQLDIPGIQPTWSMSIEYKLTGAGGEPVNGLIHNTIHALGE